MGLYVSDHIFMYLTWYTMFIPHSPTMDICYQHSPTVSDGCGCVSNYHCYDNLHKQENRYKILHIMLNYCNHVTFSLIHIPHGMRQLYNITKSCMLLCTFNKSVKVRQFFRKRGQNESAGAL